MAFRPRRTRSVPRHAFGSGPVAAGIDVAIAGNVVAIVDGLCDVTWDFATEPPLALITADCAGLRVLGAAPVSVTSQSPGELILRYTLDIATGDAWATTAASYWIKPGQSGSLVEF